MGTNVHLCMFQTLRVMKDILIVDSPNLSLCAVYILISVVLFAIREFVRKLFVNRENEYVTCQPFPGPFQVLISTVVPSHDFMFIGVE